MPRSKAQISVSLDGYMAGPNQSEENPLGEGGMDLHEWVFKLAHWQREHGRGGGEGEENPSNSVIAAAQENVGAVVMGRNMFGPVRGEWPDEDWKGWWGDEPPFHTPVFVLTHHVRPSFTLGETTFHFVDADPARALELAREAARGKDVRLGGGATTIRQFLDADLVDTMHVAVSRVEIGSGSRLWRSPDELRDRFHVDVVPSPSGVTHHLFWRR